MNLNCTTGPATRPCTSLWSQGVYRSRSFSPSRRPLSPCPATKTKSTASVVSTISRRARSRDAYPLSRLTEELAQRIRGMHVGASHRGGSVQPPDLHTKSDSHWPAPTGRTGRVHSGTPRLTSRLEKRHGTEKLHHRTARGGLPQTDWTSPNRSPTNHSNRARKSRGEQCPERPHETHRNDTTAGEDRLLVAEPTK